MTQPVFGAIQSIDHMIELSLKKVQLLQELKKSLEIAARAGVAPALIATVGYDHKKDERWTRWPAWLASPPVPTADRPGIVPEPNYIVLKTGERIDVPIDWKTPLDKAYQAWKRETAKKYAEQFKSLFTPDLSPAAFKRSTDGS